MSSEVSGSPAHLLFEGDAIHRLKIKNLGKNEVLH